MKITEKKREIYDFYCKEFPINGRGAQVSAANLFNLSRQRINQILIECYESGLPEPKYLKPDAVIKDVVCRVCGETVGADKIYKGTSVCISCRLLDRKKCPGCGNIFIGGYSRCPECNKEGVKSFYERVRVEGGERYRDLLKKKREYHKRWRDSKRCEKLGQG